MISQQEQAPGRETYPWFALRVRSNYEKVSSLHIKERGYEEFSPSYRTERQWSDRKKTIERALFPGYVFCRLDPYNRLPILTIPGVVGLVGFGSRPTPVPDQEIEYVRTLVGSGLLVTPWPFLDPGQTVLIERGPLQGVEGVLQSVKGRLRLVVAINVLQRSVATEIDRSWVRPLKKSQSSVQSTQGDQAFLSQM
jgi:transcription antitermination factor NusG